MRWITNTRKMIVNPLYTHSLYRWLIKLQNWGKLYYTRSCTAVNQNKAIMGSLITHYIYLTLTGSYQLQPLPLLLLLQQPFRPLSNMVSPRKLVSRDVTLTTIWCALIARHSLVRTWRALIAHHSLVRHNRALIARQSLVQHNTH